MNEVAEVSTDELGILRDRWYRLRRDNPKLRIRDAAKLLNVSEMQLVSLGCGESATRLSDHWLAMVAQFADFGDVMALTRNDFAVHELTGHYVPSFGPVVDTEGLTFSERRLAVEHWAHAFAVCEQSGKSNRYSVQFFDDVGDAVHKVYLTERSNRSEYAAFVARYRAQDQQPGIEPVSMHRGVATQPAKEAALPGTYLRTNALSTLLGIAAERGLDVEITVENRGASQRFAGRVRNACSMGPWFNVLDPGFSLHLREDGIAQILRQEPARDTRFVDLQAFDIFGRPVCRMAIQRATDHFSEHALQMALIAVSLPEVDGTAADANAALADDQDDISH